MNDTVAESKRDYYEILGLQKGAGEDDIKKAYRKLAKEYHPDRNPGDKAAEAKFKEIGEAYEVLSDSGKRSRYDQFGHAGVDPNFGAGGSGAYGGGFGGFGDDIDLGSIFDSLFGGGFGGGEGRANAPRRGESIRVQLILSFEEAAFGCEREIELSRIEKCEACHGTGAKAGTAPETCPTCKGAGQVRSTRRTPLGTFSSTSACETCGGRGQTIKDACPACKAAGVQRRKVAISARVPAGIDDGQTVSLRGQGHAGMNGGPNGDVLVTVSVRPHALFTRDGTAVHCEVPITFVQAALGADIEIPTLDGRVKLTIPEGTQNAATFRLRGKGIPVLGSSARGDQYVHVLVEVPKNLSKKQKQLLQEFSSATDAGNHPQRKKFFDFFQ